MSTLQEVTGLFSTIFNIIDELNVSDEEMGQLKNEALKIQSEVSMKVLELQSQVIEANAKIAVAEQEHGSSLGKNWRPITSIICALLLGAMGLDLIPFNDMLAQIAGMFLGIYGIGRTLEKRKK